MSFFFIFLVCFSIFLSEDYLYIMLYLVLLQIGVAFQFLLMGVPVLAFTFLLVYSGAISIIYIFILQLVYLNRHKFLRFHFFYVLLFFITFICLFVVFFNCMNFFTFDNLYINNFFNIDSSNFFTKFSILFYNSDNHFLPILAFSIFLGLKISLILGDTDITQNVLHQSSQQDRNSYIVFSLS